jgi:ADP-heptose:LPS heptosyltransferase
LHIKTSPRVGVVLVKVDAIGDFVLWLNFAKQLCHYYSDKKVTLVCNQLVGELATRLEYFDDVIKVDIPSFKTDLKYRFKIIRKVRKINAEIALHSTYTRKYWTGDTLIRATSATNRIGTIGDKRKIHKYKQILSDGWYTQLIPVTDTSLSELELNAMFLSGVVKEKREPGVLEIEKVTNLPSDKTISGNYFVIFPGASWEGRRWSPGLFAELVFKLSKDYDYQIVISGTSAESVLANDIIDMSGINTCLDLTGKSSLLELIEIIRGARLLISNETSAIHIAAAVNTPSVCILGGGHYGRFVPYIHNLESDITRPLPVYKMMDCFGCNWQCTKQYSNHGPVPCIDLIDVDTVMNAIRSVTKLKSA